MSEPEEPTFDDAEKRDAITGRQQYNLVTDLVVGPNLRLKDNVIQGVSILVCLLLGGGIGSLVVDEWLAGLLVGGFIGMLAGLFGSGIYLMVYRAVKHARREHD